jgi:nucleoside-diphosphate-sugar epimerase
MPTTPYGVHKLAAELHHRNYGHLLGLRTTALRISIPFGAHLYVGTRDYGVANRFVQLAVQDQALLIYGFGHQLRDYVYVDDVVSALALAGATEVSDGRVYNVGSGEGVALADFARLVVAKAGCGRLEFRDWPELSLAVETGDFVADINRIRSELGWAPRVSLQEGVQRTVRHVRGALASHSGTMSAGRDLGA